MEKFFQPAQPQLFPVNQTFFQQVFQSIVPLTVSTSCWFFGCDQRSDFEMTLHNTTEDICHSSWCFDLEPSVEDN